MNLMANSGFQLLTIFRSEKFKNRWLPFPLFSLGNSDKFEFLPIDWNRLKPRFTSLDLTITLLGAIKNAT